MSAGTSYRLRVTADQLDLLAFQRLAAAPGQRPRPVSRAPPAMPMNRRSGCGAASLPLT